MQLSKETLIEISKCDELSTETKDKILLEHFQIEFSYSWQHGIYVGRSDKRIRYSDVKDIICNYQSTFGRYIMFDNVDDFCKVIGNANANDLYGKYKYESFHQTAQELINDHVFNIDELEKLVAVCRKFKKYSLPRVDFILNCDQRTFIHHSVNQVF